MNRHRRLLPLHSKLFVEVNPISLVSDAARGLMLGGVVAEPLYKSITWMAGITTVFGVLAVRRYRRRT